MRCQFCRAQLCRRRRRRRFTVDVDVAIHFAARSQHRPQARCECVRKR
jgi:hypothetical protein